MLPSERSASSLGWLSAFAAVEGFEPLATSRQQPGAGCDTGATGGGGGEVEGGECHAFSVGPKHS